MHPPGHFGVFLRVCVPRRRSSCDKLATVPSLHGLVVLEHQQVPGCSVGTFLMHQHRSVVILYVGMVCLLIDIPRSRYPTPNPIHTVLSYSFRRSSLYLCTISGLISANGLRLQSAISIHIETLPHQWRSCNDSYFCLWLYWSLSSS